jgi:hypothetical protein
LRRVHFHQPLQCPRCTRTDFWNSTELQAHQTAPEPCNLVSLTDVKRIRWISDDERVALQKAVRQESRNLGGCTEKDRWGFAYRWLFPPTTLDDTPCPCKCSGTQFNFSLLTVIDMQDPVISIVSFVVDDYETRLRQLIRQSSDLEDFSGRVPAIREQFLAQYNISNNGSEQLPPSLSNAMTTPGDTLPGRPTTLSPPVVDEARQSNAGSPQHRYQAVLPPVYRAYGSIAPPEHSPTFHIPQATSSGPQPHGAASTHQLTATSYGHTDTSHPHAPANSYLMMSPTQWQYQPSADTPAQEYRVLSPVDLTTSVTQSQYQQIQEVTAPQYHSE